MITMDRLLQILDDWKVYDKYYKEKLGFPNKALGMSSGGASSHEAFEHLISGMDLQNAETMASLINSLPKGQRAAIRHKYFKEPKPIAYEWQYDMAMDNLLTWATKRIAA